MDKIIILMLLTMLIGCKQRTSTIENNRAITNVITIQEGCGGTKIYEIELRDGTRCAVLDDNSITCEWSK